MRTRVPQGVVVGEPLTARGHPRLVKIPVIQKKVMILVVVSYIVYIRM